jgi:hypothetical protein
VTDNRASEAAGKQRTLLAEAGNRTCGDAAPKSYPVAIGVWRSALPCWAVMASPLIWNCLTTKHPAYAHEREVRLILLGLTSSLAPYVTTRLRGSEIVPYVPHQLPLKKEGSLAGIVVGPAAPVDAVRTVRTLLRSLGYDPELPVSRSDIPYRAL